MSNVLQFKKRTDSIELTPVETKTWNILGSPVKDVGYYCETYNVSHQTVRNIKMLKTERAKAVAQKMRDHGVEPIIWEPAKRFTPEEIAHIRQSNAKSKTLAKTYGVAPSTIRMIRTGQTYVG